MSIYDLVKLGKEKQQIDSDRAFALKNGLSPQNVVDWKSGKAKKATIEHYVRLCVAAGITMQDGLPYVIEEEELKHCILC